VVRKGREGGGLLDMSFKQSSNSFIPCTRLRNICTRYVSISCGVHGTELMIRICCVEIRSKTERLWKQKLRFTLSTVDFPESPEPSSRTCSIFIGGVSASKMGAVLEY